MTRIGALGCAWRATVSSWGRVDPDDGTPSVDWFVAADDRWHVPEHESSRRQRRLGGTPVVETRIRIPGGDVVHTVGALGDGRTVFELRNDSPSPIAVAFTRADLVSSTAPLTASSSAPAGTISFPIGHRSSRTVVLPQRADRAVLGALPSLESVVRGWTRQVERGTRYDVPTGRDELVAARCDIVLDGPTCFADAVDRLIAVGEWLRLGEDVRPYVRDVARDASEVARRCATVVVPEYVWALGSATDVLRAAGERNGEADAQRWLTALDQRGRDRVVSGVALLGALRARLVTTTADSMTLMPDPAPEWFGEPVAVHSEPTRWGALSYAIRWHGDRPALLWELDGRGAPTIRCGLDATWSSRAPYGETLLATYARS